MKEYTSIEITSSDLSLDEIINIDNFIHFKYLDNNHKIVQFSGRPIEVKDGAILFNTQTYYHRIPLSQGNEGTQVEVFADFRKTNKIADGLIKKKFYEPAIKSDWKIKSQIENSTRIIAADIPLNKSERQILVLGLKPLAMEDKWFIYVEDDVISCVRSWTGIEIYKAKIEQISEDKWQIKQVNVNSSFDVEDEFALDNFVSLITGQIKYYGQLLEY